MTEGLPRYFVPVCVRRLQGYAGGPIGYVERPEDGDHRTIVIDQRQIPLAKGQATAIR